MAISNLFESLIVNRNGSKATCLRTYLVTLTELPQEPF